jgi:hypothetical protein
VTSTARSVPSTVTTTAVRSIKVWHRPVYVIRTRPAVTTAPPRPRYPRYAIVIHWPFHNCYHLRRQVKNVKYQYAYCKKQKEYKNCSEAHCSIVQIQKDIDIRSRPLSYPGIACK